MYDIIPDIHADLERLRKTLKRLNYTRSNGCYRHAEGRRAVFLGDLIDGGSHNAKVVEIVREMISEGQAKCIMGNHELNAILYHTEGSHGPLRPRSQKNTKQHQTFLDEFPSVDPTTLEVIEFFKTLPLAMDLGEFRVVHACWHQPSLDALGFDGQSVFLDCCNLEAAADETGEENPVAMLLKGPEVSLPEGYSFLDIKGHERREVRLKWWAGKQGTLGDVVLSVPDPDQIPDTEIPSYMESILYPPLDKPVFCGHYKMQGTPSLDSLNAVCLDYPKTPCAYRWVEGGEVLKTNQMVVI